MKQKVTMFDTMAKRVLAHYDLSEPHISFIRHSDNVTYRVSTAESKEYLLRIHIPITSAMGSHGLNYRMVNSEVAWMSALSQETDLTIQKPIRNESGELVTRIPRADGSTINATLLSWIQGEPYHRELENEETAYRIGKLLAIMHDQASQWEFPKDFLRPRRDVEYFAKMLNGIQPAVHDGRISRADYSELSKSISLLIDLLSGLDEDPRNYGIMHADTHKGNMLYDKGNIRLIDFSFCAIGNYMFDLGICFGDMKEELHRFCLQGYRSVRPLSGDYERSIEGFFIGSIVGTFSFWAHNPNAQEILARKVPQITRDYSVRFNRDERFWL